MMTNKLPLAKASRRLSRMNRPIPPKSIPSAYYLANRERIIAQGRRWYYAHREQVLAQRAADYAKTPRRFIERVYNSRRRQLAQQPVL